MTVANFVGLAEGTIENSTIPLGKPYFDGAIIHRVEEGHVIQGGSPPVKNNKGTGYRYPNEIHPDLSHDKAGMLGVANGGPHTNSDEFYITLGDRSYLDGDYIVFGHVTEGMDVLFSIEKGDIFESIRILRFGKEAKKFRPDTKMFKELIEKQWEKVRLAEKEKAEKEDAIIKERWPDAILSASGYRYQVIEEGNTGKVRQGSVLKVQYSGELFNGKKFISTSGSGNPSFGETSEVFEFEIGKSRIIRAFDEVLREMKPGEIRVIIVPPEMGYGRGGFYGKNIPGTKRFVISPNSKIVYRIELIGID